MKTATMTSNTVTAAQVARALAHAAALLTVYIIQTVATAARTAYRLARMARHWLNTRHDFDTCHEEPVILTGWQYIGLSLLASIIMIALSIDLH